jgi:hypothetical protein
MENEIKNEEKKQSVIQSEGKKEEGEQPQQESPKRQIIITIQGNNLNMEKCETASVFELQGILENILRQMSIKQ